MWPVPAPPPRFLGGSAGEESRRLAAAAGELRALQDRLRRLSADGRAGRTFHRMGRAFPASYVPLPPDRLDPHFVPPEIRTALLDPALQVQAGFARLSHGRGDDNVDGLMPDVRGLWVRLQATGGVQDLTATNGEVPFAHDPEELIAFGSATAELLQASRAHPLLTPVALVSFEPHLAAELRRLKPAEFTSDLAAHARAAAILAAVAPSAVPVHSLAETQFWSGAPLYIRGTDGRTYAFKFTFKPPPEIGRSLLPSRDLFAELVGRRRVRFELLIQLYVDDERTPIERVARWEVPERKVGDVEIATDAAILDDRVDPEGSNPANAFPGISPAGLNRLRVDLYAADTRGRGGHPFTEGRLFESRG